MTLPYATAARRADAALYDLTVHVTCQWCGEKIPCRVVGTDVEEIGQCACEEVPSTTRERAYLIAAAQRDELTREYRG